jgi:hypothetical protein
MMDGMVEPVRGLRRTLPTRPDRDAEARETGIITRTSPALETRW